MAKGSTPCGIGDGGVRGAVEEVHQSGPPRGSVRASSCARRWPRAAVAGVAGAVAPAAAPVISPRPAHPRDRSRTSTVCFQGGHLLFRRKRVMVEF